MKTKESKFKELLSFKIKDMTMFSTCYKRQFTKINRIKCMSIYILCQLWSKYFI